MHIIFTDNSQTNDNYLGSTNPEYPFSCPTRYLGKCHPKFQSGVTANAIPSIPYVPRPRLSSNAKPLSALVHCIRLQCLLIVSWLSRSHCRTINVDVNRALSLSHAVAISRAPSVKMKEIFIGFCSDFKWICGSILNGKVRRQHQHQLQLQQQRQRQQHSSTFNSTPLADPCLWLYRFYSNLYVYFILCVIMRIF